MMTKLEGRVNEMEVIIHNAIMEKKLQYVRVSYNSGDAIVTVKLPNGSIASQRFSSRIGWKVWVKELVGIQDEDTKTFYEPLFPKE
jgi:hypothetical protein